MGPAERNERQNLTRNFVGWGRRIRTPATWSRATRPTTRRSPTNASNLTTPPNNSADGGLERAARAEARDLGRRNLDLFAGAGVASVAGGAARDHESAESRDRDAATAAERLDDAADERVHGTLSGRLRASRVLRHDCHELGLGHREPRPLY